MMNKEEYLEAVIELLHYATYNANRVEKRELNEDAKKIKRLINDYFDKETPKKLDDSVYGEFRCPTCGYPFLRGCENYCCDCGQHLDWSKDENKCIRND